MNAMLSATLPLPAVLERPTGTGIHRRHCIENFCLTEAAVETFNRVLVRLGRCEAPLGCDQLATAARELSDARLQPGAPPCIRQRLHRVKTAARMVEDRGWRADDGIVTTVRLVVDYVFGHDDLIPDWIPKVGRLDDALVADAACSSLGDEVDGYLDFCRMRTLVAAGRGRADPGFDRAAWRQARAEEAALAMHQRRVRETSYLSIAAPRFIIH